MLPRVEVPAVLVLIATVAVAFAMPATAAITKPTWTSGDYWLFSVRSGSTVSGTQRIDVLGQETVIVGGRPYLSYRTLFDSRLLMAGAPSAYFNLTGTAWYRTSDLALVVQDLNGTIEFQPMSFSIWERLTWDPPQDVRWPLVPGTTWSAPTWSNSTLEVGGPPQINLNVFLTTSFVVHTERPVTVPAGTFLTTPLNGTTNGYSNVTYWSPVAGNGVLIQAFDPMGAEIQRLELTSYRYQAGVADTTPPTIADVAATPPTQTEGGSVTISATVTDNTAVVSIFVNVTQPNGTHVNRTMVRGAGDTKTYTSTWSQVGVHPFVVWAADTAGNWASAPGSFTIARDTTPPSITRTAPDVVYVGDTITINATVMDPDSAVQDVRLVYTPVGGTEQNVSMPLFGTSYTHTTPAQSRTGIVRYRLYAIDPSGNARLTQEYTVSVQKRPSAPGLDIGLVAGFVVILLVTFVSAMLMLSRRRKGRGTSPAPSRPPP